MLETVIYSKGKHVCVPNNEISKIRCLSLALFSKEQHVLMLASVEAEVICVLINSIQNFFSLTLGIRVN